MIFVLCRSVLVISFDPTLATTLRMRVDFYNNLLLILLTSLFFLQWLGVEFCQPAQDG